MGHHTAKENKGDGWVNMEPSPPNKKRGHTSVENSQAECARSCLAFASWEGNAGKGAAGRLPFQAIASILACFLFFFFLPCTHVVIF